MSRETLLLAVAKSRALEDPSHDYQHVLRVMANAKLIARAEGADERICVAAASLHELFNYPKGHPESKRSGEVCAEHARKVLAEMGEAPAMIEAVGYAIAVHPFSLGITPTTLEAKVLQDADRLDSIGAIGIARCFASCAEMKRPFYSIDDPLCVMRTPNDKEFGVDHFFNKLLHIPSRLHTDTAKRLAEPRMQVMQDYLAALGREVTRMEA